MIIIARKHETAQVTDRRGCWRFMSRNTQRIEESSVEPVSVLGLVSQSMTSFLKLPTRLGLSPQCGFASVWEGNPLTEAVSSCEFYQASCWSILMTQGWAQEVDFSQWNSEAGLEDRLCVWYVWWRLRLRANIVSEAFFSIPCLYVQ